MAHLITEVGKCPDNPVNRPLGHNRAEQEHAAAKGEHNRVVPTDPALL